ncbi:MAG TPA: hypothetical protein VLL52_24895, partial [Anaerolineae bacterium]|nr:hypothetical protein [Anaerolineae bacterium]
TDTLSDRWHPEDRKALDSIFTEKYEISRETRLAIVLAVSKTKPNVFMEYCLNQLQDISCFINLWQLALRASKDVAKVPAPPSMDAKFEYLYEQLPFTRFAQTSYMTTKGLKSRDDKEVLQVAVWHKILFAHIKPQKYPPEQLQKWIDEMVAFMKFWDQVIEPFVSLGATTAEANLTGRALKSVETLLGLTFYNFNSPFQTKLQRMQKKIEQVTAL